MFRVFVLLLISAFAFAAKVPRQLADMTLTPALGGKKITTSSYRGKTLVVAFLSTSCKPCASAVRVLNKVQKEYASKGVVMLAAAIGPPEEVRLFIAKNHPEFPVVTVDENEFRTLADHPKPERPYVPMFLFVDKKGTVQTQQMADPAFMKVLEPGVRTLTEATVRKN